MRRLILLAAAATVAAFGVATPAAATAPKQDCKTATTHLVDRPDSGVGGTWALDTFTRTVTICETAAVAADVKADLRVPVALATYHATVVDEGTFVTVGGRSPDGHGALCRGCHGRLRGGFTADFVTLAGFKGYKATFDHKTYRGTAPSSTGDWIAGLWGSEVKVTANLKGLGLGLLALLAGPAGRLGGAARGEGRAVVGQCGGREPGRHPRV